MKEAVYKTLKIIVIALSIIMIIYCAFPSFFVSLFIDNKQVIEIGSVIIRGFAIALPFIGIDFVGVGVFQATGYGKLSLIFAILRKIVLEIPFLFILNYLWPLYGLGFAQACAEFILAIGSLIVLSKLFKKWSSNAY